MAQCFFCDRDETLTRAHLFQTRFRNAIGAGDGMVSLASSSVATPGVNRDLLFPGDIRERYVTSLCRNCNNIWMNDIECAAAPVFESIMQLKGFPPPSDLFKLAHWATVVGALSSELYHHVEIPVALRREIRNTATGQPTYYSTYFIWTNDYLESLETSFFRVIAADDAIHWFHVLHAGPLVAISSTPLLGSRIARVLEENGIQSVLGLISSNLVYTARGLREAAEKGVGRPTHKQVHDLLPVLLETDSAYIRTKGTEVLDLSGGLKFRNVDLSFDFSDRLTDVRDQLDLDYLDGAFPRKNV